MVTLERQLFTEVFPIDVAALPPLHAYRLEVSDGAAYKLGGKLAYRLRQQFPGCWVWYGDRLMTDTEPEQEALEGAVAAIKKQQSKVYSKLKGIEADLGWQPSPDEIAAFVARGPLASMHDAMREALARTTFAVRNARVEREHRVRTWVVDDQPAVSFSVVSHLIYNVDVAEYARTLDKPAELVGVLVTDKNSTMQGQIIKVVGPLSSHRERLLGLTQKAATRSLLQAAPDDELVLRVASGQNEYDYTASALQVLVGLADIDRFGLDANHAARALRLKPSLRAQMVKVVADLAKNSGLVGNAYSTQNLPEPFEALPDEDANIVFHNNRVRPYDIETLGQEFESSGAYWTRDRFQTEPVRIAVINSLTEPVDDFMEALRRLVRSDFGFEIEVVRERKVRVVSQSNLESAVRALQKEPHDVLLVFVNNEQEDDDGDDAYDRFVKAQTVGRGAPCLVIHESTLHKPEAMNQLIMGIFARAGNVPYLFDEALPYADYVIGLDLMRYGKKNDTVTGTVRVYRNDGALMGYAVATETAAGDEVIPQALLETLLSGSMFAGMRVAFHIDGLLRREERAALDGWAHSIGATFSYVEIMRRGVPRVYALEAGKIARPPRGSVFRLGDNEAFVVTSSAGADATPQPLHVRATGLPVEDALHSVMMLTLLHYGALKTPKLPVTIHHAEYIRSSLVRGVLLANTSGDLPFWL